MKRVLVEKLTKENFSPFGDIIETAGRKFEIINDNRCRKFGELSTVKIKENDDVSFSIFESEGQNLPFQLNFLERHPLASQAFMPLHQERFLITVAEDVRNTPKNLKAFLTNGSQGININPNVWHGVLCPVPKAGRFLVVDRLKTHDNLQIHNFNEPLMIGEEF